MPKRALELGPLAVQRLTSPGFHSVGGVSGLGLYVTRTGGRSWVLRYNVDKKRREMGLGPYPDVTLANAREKARAERAKLDEGHDPLQLREAQRRTNAAARAVAMTFEAASSKLMTALKVGWKNEKHAQQWVNTLKTYAYPVLGPLDVRDIGLPHVLQVLEPIWTIKNETATRVRSRIEQVLDWCTVHGYREGLNPARWRGHLDKILAKPSKVAKVVHHPALAVDQIGEFMARLAVQPGVGARALQFAILTAARSGEVRGATWGEFDLDDAMWVIPASRMKAGREHRVPLSPAAIALVKASPQIAGSEFVFTAPRGGALSDMTLSAVLRRMKVAAVPHGFRSTFRDWAAERTSYPGEMAEMALAHVISDKVEAAYRRGDMLNKRRRMMTEWAEFCSINEPKGAVIPLNKKTAA